MFDEIYVLQIIRDYELRINDRTGAHVDEILGSLFKNYSFLTVHEF